MGSYFCQYLQTETLDADVVRVSFNLFVNGCEKFIFSTKKIN
jgi:hypothetical protein